MSRMFGDRIFEFVLSVDIMDKETFDDLMLLIQTYVQEHLDVTYFSILDLTVVNDQQGLRTIWSSRDESPSYTVDKDAGYASHSAYTFGENKAIWVVSESKQPLQTAGDLINLWSNADEREILPPYCSRSQDEVRTSVMHPLRKERLPIGVVEFAAERYIEPTPASLEEAQTLAAVISRAYQMYDVRRAQRDNTKRAMQLLQGALKTQTWTRLALPQMFVAYPGTERLDTEARTEHQAVIKTLRDVIDEFSDVVSAVYWEDITEAGNISEQVVHSINNSEFGLCYFSEPTPDAHFQDNANVLFEAGMMQALANSPGALLRAWLPVREKNSAKIPFDIATERMVPVDRNEDGKLNEEAFSISLRQHMSTLIKNLDRKVKDDKF